MTTRPSEQTIFTGHGIKVLQRGRRFFIRFNAGGLVVDTKEAQVSEEDALLAQRSEDDAYRVLLRAKEKGRW
jgi:hypothetical protein